MEQKHFGKEDKDISEKQKTLQELRDTIKTIKDNRVEKQLWEDIANLMRKEEIMWA